MSPDTGAREPQRDLVSALTRARADIVELVNEGWDSHRWDLGTAAVRRIDAALAAGVGVPPDEDLVSAPAKERQDAREPGQA